MADKDTPSQGSRWTSDPDTVEVADRYAEGIGETDEGTGGISNRELSEEIGRQEHLPERGKNRGDQEAEQETEPSDVEEDVER